jgi:hypothetical protein
MLASNRQYGHCQRHSAFGALHALPSIEAGAPRPKAKRTGPNVAARSVEDNRLGHTR